MPTPVLVRIIVTWLLFLPVPILNGMLREKWYKPIVGVAAAHQIGTLVVSAMFLLYAYASLRFKAPELSTGQLWVIGVVWLLMTLLFEFGIGLATGRSWSYMLADYKVWQGRIWPLVPLVTLLSPFFVKMIINK